jgi:hypothetical protein
VGNEEWPDFASAYFFLRTAWNGVLTGLVGDSLPGVPRMSEGERLRELAAYYLRMADVTSRNDVRNWLVALAAETLEKAHAFERQEMARPVINPTVQQPAQQQQQIQPEDDDPKKE